MLAALVANPHTGCRAMIEGAFGSGNGVINTALKAAPPLLAGAGRRRGSS